MTVQSHNPDNSKGRPLARLLAARDPLLLDGCCGTTPDHIAALREAFPLQNQG